MLGPATVYYLITTLFTKKKIIKNKIIDSNETLKIWHTWDSIHPGFIVSNFAFPRWKHRIVLQGSAVFIIKLFSCANAKKTMLNILLVWYAKHKFPIAYDVLMSEPYVCKLVYDSPEPQNNRFVVNNEKWTMHCFSNNLWGQHSQNITLWKWHKFIDSISISI